MASGAAGFVFDATFFLLVHLFNNLELNFGLTEGFPCNYHTGAFHHNLLKKRN
jgi:hypothetical protein